MSILFAVENLKLLDLRARKGFWNTCQDSSINFPKL